MEPTPEQQPLVDKMVDLARPIQRPPLSPEAVALHQAAAEATKRAKSRLDGMTEEMLRGLKPGQRLAVGSMDAKGSVQMLVLQPGQEPPTGKCWTVYGPAPLDPDLGPLEYGISIKDGADLQWYFGVDPEHMTHEQAMAALGGDQPETATPGRISITGDHETIRALGLQPTEAGAAQVLAAFSPRVTVEPRPTMGIWEVYVDGTRDIPEAPLMVEAVTRAQAQRKAVLHRLAPCAAPEALDVPFLAAMVAARHVKQLRRMVPADRVADAWRLGVGRARRGA